MTIRKKGALSLCLLTALVLLLCAGAALSATELYTGATTRIAKADVSVNNITLDSSTMTDYDADIATNAPGDATAIATAEELKNFLDGDSSYGYFTSDITYDRETVDGARTLNEGKTLDGNGHTLRLTSTASYATSENFGLLVDVNYGTLKNLKIVYDSALTIGNAGSVWKQNNVGILTGANYGEILNCDISVIGSFAYNYDNTKIDNIEGKNDVFVTAFGGFAGGNAGTIKNILAEYRGASVSLYTYANYTSTFRLDSKAVFGGAVGTSLSADSVCSDVIAISDASTSVSLRANKTDGNGETGLAYREAAAVQSNISNKSELFGKVDNVIVSWQGSYGSLTNSGSVNQNAAVNSGNSTNVTVIDVSKGTYSDQTGAGRANYITLEGCTVSIKVKDGVQTLAFTPDGGKLMAMQNFTNYIRENVAEGANVEGVPVNGETAVYADENNQLSYVLEIPAYQTEKENYWSLHMTAYAQKTLTVSEGEFSYTGKDYISEIFTIDGAPITSGTCNILNNGTPVSQIMMPGEYDIALGTVTANVVYVDTENKVIALKSEDAHYSVKINYADIASIPADTDWLSSFRYNFVINGAVEGAADGYVYEVNGSLPKQVKGLVMSSDFDTTKDGRTYLVYLTRNGTRVSNTVVFNVRVDANAPVIGDVAFEKPLDEYYSANVVTFKASDYASGVAKVTLNGKTLSGDGNGAYTANVIDGNNVIVVTDVAGNSSTYEFEAKIDAVRPVLSYDVYYFDSTGEKQAYKTIGFGIGYALYADLSNTVFGKSGGKIYYRQVGEEEWIEYTDVLEFRSPEVVEFKAVSNNKDYDSDSVYETVSASGIYFNVKIGEITVSADDIVISGLDKTFDGTTQFKGSVSFKQGLKYSTEGLSLRAEYADVNAGENVAVKVYVDCDRQDVRVINKIEGITGNIFKKQISVIADDAQKVASQPNPVFTYTSDQVSGFEEEILLVTTATATSAPGEYDITLAESEYVNYVVASFEKGTLTVSKFVIDRMVYDFTTISGLDTSNVKGVVVGFRQFTGEYVDFDVTYEYSATADGEYAPCDGMTLAGYYRVTLFVPEEMADSYEIKAGLESFIVKVIDSDMFAPIVESGESQALEYLENYAQRDAEKDNATVIIMDYGNIGTSEYVTALSVFCLCILAAFFVVGCARVLAVKHRERNRNKKA